MTDDRAFEILKSAGWSSDRSIDISEILQYMTTEKLPVFEEAKSFFQEFGDLKFYYPLDDSNNYIGFAFIIKYGVDIINDTNNELLKDYQKMLEIKDITIIGSYSSTMTLLIDNNSYIYAVDDNYVICFGKNLQGVVNIIKGEATQRLTPDWW